MRSHPQYPIQIQKPLLYDKGIGLGFLFKRPKLHLAGQLLIKQQKNCLHPGSNEGPYHAN